MKFFFFLMKKSINLHRVFAESLLTDMYCQAMDVKVNKFFTQHGQSFPTHLQSPQNTNVSLAQFSEPSAREVRTRAMRQQTEIRGINYDRIVLPDE